MKIVSGESGLGKRKLAPWRRQRRTRVFNFISIFRFPHVFHTAFVSYDGDEGWRCDLRELLTLTDSQCRHPERLPGPEDGGRRSRISGLCLNIGLFVFVTVIRNRVFLCTACNDNAHCAPELITPSVLPVSPRPQVIFHNASDHCSESDGNN